MGHSIPFAWAASHLAAMGAGYAAKMAVHNGNPPEWYEGDVMTPVNRYVVGPAAGNAAGYTVNAIMGDPVGASVTAATTGAQLATQSGAALIGSTLADWTAKVFR